MVAERFALVDVGQVHFDHRQFHRGQGVAQRHRGVGPGGGVDDDAGDPAAGLVDPVEQLAFLVGLAEVHGEAARLGEGRAFVGDFAQGPPAVGLWLAGAEQIQVGAVQDQYRARHGAASTAMMSSMPGKCTERLLL